MRLVDIVSSFAFLSIATVVGGCADGRGDYPALLTVEEMGTAVNGPAIADGAGATPAAQTGDLISAANNMRRRADALRAVRVIDPELRQKMAVSAARSSDRDRD